MMNEKMSCFEELKTIAFWKHQQSKTVKNCFILLTYKSFVQTNLKNNDIFFTEQTNLKNYFLLKNNFLKQNFEKWVFFSTKQKMLFFCSFYWTNTFLIGLLKKKKFSECAILFSKQLIEIMIFLKYDFTEWMSYWTKNLIKIWSFYKKTNQNILKIIDNSQN